MARTHRADSAGDAGSTDTVAAFPTRYLPAPKVRELPPEPQRFVRLIGPGIIAAGVGLASGEFILYPVHRLPGRAGVRLGGAGRPDHPVLPQHGDRAVHARHRGDRAHRIQPVLAALGAGLRAPHLLREPVAGLGHELGDPGHLPVRRRAALDRHRHADHDRADPHAGSGRLRRPRARSDAQGGRGPAPVRRRRRRRDRRVGVARPPPGRHRGADPGRANSASRCCSARWPSPAAAAGRTSCRRTGSATRASAWAPTSPAWSAR